MKKKNSKAKLLTKKQIDMIQSLRDKGVSQSEVAKKVGCSVKSVYNWQ